VESSGESAQPLRRWALFGEFLRDGLQWLAPLILALVLALGSIAGGRRVESINWDVFGYFAPDHAAIRQLIAQGSAVTPSGHWRITYQSPTESEFHGVARIVSSWWDRSMPFMSHDVLVVTQDFADPARTRAHVRHHMFSYQPIGAEPARGSINLLHVVPATDTVYATFQRLRVGDRIVVRGREILTLERLDGNGAVIGTYKDAGCNSLVATAIEVSPP
jgi:hypothetical protein